MRYRWSVNLTDMAKCLLVHTSARVTLIMSPAMNTDAILHCALCYHGMVTNTAAVACHIVESFNFQKMHCKQKKKT